MSFLFSQPAPGVLPANSVDFSEVETIASNTLLGNNTGSDSVILELSKTQVTAMLDAMGAASAGAGGLKGLVPASSAGDQAKFLRGDATWATVSLLPSQTSNANKVLVTDGTNASWQFAGLGAGSLPSNTIILGRDLPSGMTATSGILIGTGSNLGTGTNQVIIGASSGRSTTGATGASNTVVGAGSFNSASLTSAASNTIIGQGNGTALTTGSNHIIIGQSSGTGLTTATGSIIIGQNSAKSLTTSATGIIIGYNAATNLTGGVPQVAIGESVLGNVTTGSVGGVYIGHQSGFANQGQADVGGSNVFVGNYTGYQNIGSFNTKIGEQAARATGGSYNTFIGYASGYGLFGQCTNNSGLGSNSIRSITSGSNNTSLGFFSGYLLTTGGSNVFLGANAGYRSTTQSNELFIDNQDRTTYAAQQTKSLIYGVFNATETSQTLRLNAQTQLVYGEKHASAHNQTGTLDVITATTSNYYIGVDTSSAAKTVNLPAAATAGQGFVLVIKDESGNAATRNITIDANASETIDGALTQVVNTNYGSVNLMCSGSAWFIM